jgi:PAS domain S-box-containing protein
MPERYQRTKEAELKSTLEALPLAAYVFDVRGQRFISANRMFCELVGYSEEELKKLPWQKLLADPAEVAAGQQAIEAPQFDVPIVFSGRRKDGTPISAALKYRAMRFVRDDGQVIEAYFTVVTSVEGENPKPATEVFKG